MKFYAEPNLTVMHRVKVGMTNTWKQELVCKFDENGEFETYNAVIIEKLKGTFDTKPQDGLESIETTLMVCKHCGEEFTNKGLLMAHYRKHKKEDK